MRKSFKEQLAAFFSDKKVLILGFGREGKTAYELLRGLNITARLGVADADARIMTELQNDSETDLHVGENYLGCLSEYDIVLQSPGVSLKGVRIPENVLITGQTDLLFRFCENKIVGVTGTKGKSTTASLIYHLLTFCGKKAVLIGNIGVPPLKITDYPEPDTIIICEASCHQLEHARHSPPVAVYLNLYEEHLDHYEDFAAYKAAKENIFLYQKASDLLIANMDLIKNISAESKILSAVPDACNETAADIAVLEKKLKILDKTVDIANIRSNLQGRHNLYNIAIALAVATELGCDLEQAVSGVAGFGGLPHRLEKIGEINGVTYINDSISTIPAATVNALRAFPGTDTLILGGMDRGIDYAALTEFLPACPALERVLCLPDSGYRVAKELRAYNPEWSSQRIKLVKDLPEAVSCAKAAARRLVLLSPAAASYGFYTNFEQRGEHFRQLIINN